VDDQAHVVLGETQTGRIPTGDGSTDMNSGPHSRMSTPPARTADEPHRQTLRLTLKPKAPTTGYVDGAWWPRSQDLCAELPALLAELALRVGRVQRVSYHLTDWDVAPRRLTIDGRSIRLGGFHSQHAHTADVIGLNGPRVTLLVVPPETRQATANQVLMRASRRGNTNNIGDLLTPTATPEPVPAASDLPDVAVERWEADGGRVPEPSAACVRRKPEVGAEQAV
jgi:hypothetical protein